LEKQTFDWIKGRSSANVGVYFCLFLVRTTLFYYYSLDVNTVMPSA